jgi:hypothetical protein
MGFVLLTHKYLKQFAMKEHCKKELAIFPSPAGMSLTKLSLGGKKLNYSRPGRVWSVTSRRLGTENGQFLFTVNWEPYTDSLVRVRVNLIMCDQRSAPPVCRASNRTRDLPYTTGRRTNQLTTYNKIQWNFSPTYRDVILADLILLYITLCRIFKFGGTLPKDFSTTEFL